MSSGVVVGAGLFLSREQPGSDDASLIVSRGFVARSYSRRRALSESCAPRENFYVSHLVTRMNP